MTTCAACGRELSADFAFCPSCGAAIAPPEPESEQRKVVTVVFCDVTGSTALGERTDPELLRDILARYFERMKGIVERHGGTVEKFVGDAVMAIFGVPLLHEDDALRAVRAAAEMLAAVDELGIRIRVGVNTGEVVTGTRERLATGDAVNVAARLEQAAAPGEALLGAETVRLVRDAVSVEPVEPLALKGKSEPVAAFRLVAVGAGEDAFRRRLDLPLVGRERELRLLREAYAIASSERSCHLFTLLGAAGVGKTRLAQEFTRDADARVVAGRCLAYGEGITYWPLVEILGRLGHSDLEGLLEGSVDEIAYASRKLLEADAADGPLIVLWEDVHWAQPALLDLIEHVADWSRGAPLLVLCLGRPELLDVRPGWGGGKLNSSTLLLEALPAGEAGTLLDRLAPALDESLRRRILASADGNPLFVEEMVAMLEEAGDEAVVVPPTIQALLAARIDQLRGGERSALECGSVEGHVFHTSGVAALADDAADVVTHLLGLVRKELVRPAPSPIPGEEAFRFRHILIRDAAYEALPKARRAELHERFASWLLEHGGTLLELDEIAGYHLEQAHHYGVELGRAPGDLGSRAARHLVAAGRAAHERLDVHAAVGLLARAAMLLGHDEPLRREVVVELAEAHFDAGDHPACVVAVDEAAELARQASDAHVAARAELVRLAAEGQWGGAGSRAGVTLAALDRLAAEARARGDDRVLATSMATAGATLFAIGDCTGCAHACEEAVDAALKVGARRTAGSALEMWCGAVRFGPWSVADGLAFFDRLDERGLAVNGFGVLCRGELAALGGDHARGRADAQAALAFAEDRGLELARGGYTANIGAIEQRAGDLVAAEQILRRGWEHLAGLGETAYRSSVGGALAQVLVDLGRFDEADAVALEALGLAEASDVESQSRSRAARARVLARRGEAEQALALVAEARRLLEPTDFLDERGDVVAVQAEVLALTGRIEEATAALEEALSLYERKGAVASAQAARRMFDAVTAPPG